MNANTSQILFSQLPTQNILLLIGVALIPLLALSMTSYIKVSVVFSILRSAFGAGQIPTNTVSGILTLLITLYTMEPLMREAASRFESQSKSTTYQKMVNSIQPFTDFVSKNTSEEEKHYFKELECARNNSCNRQTALNENISLSLLAFITSELKAAFNLGVRICIPFLIIDLVVSTLLTALGMMMVSPVTITFPLKLLLFIYSDGWSLLISHLIKGYQI